MYETAKGKQHSRNAKDGVLLTACVMLEKHGTNQRKHVVKMALLPSNVSLM